MQFTNTAYLLIGGNVGNTAFEFQKAIKHLNDECGRIVSQSSIYHTAPWGNENQPPFLNQALKLNTNLLAPALMPCLLQIEEKMGRKRDLKYGPRIIDIDILLFNN